MALVAVVIVVSSIVADQVWNAQLRLQFDESLSGEVREFVAAAADLQSAEELADFAEQYLRLHQYEEPSRILLLDLGGANPLTLQVPTDGRNLPTELPQSRPGAISLRTLHPTESRTE